MMRSTQLARSNQVNGVRAARLESAAHERGIHLGADFAFIQPSQFLYHLVARLRIEAICLVETRVYWPN